jgi:hypothetical protein
MTVYKENIILLLDIVYPLKGRTQTEGVRKQSAEDDIWSKEG